MLRLEDALVEVTHFAEHPPLAAPPVAALRARTRRRHVRRRAVVGSFAVIVLVAAGVGVRVATRADESVRATEPGPAPVTATTAPAAGFDATADPADGLEDGDLVTVTFAVPAQSVAAQCAAEAVAPNADEAQWCDLNVRPDPETGGNALEFRVSRVIETTNGLIDCAEAPRRCVLGAYRGGSGAPPMWAAISFRTDLAPVPETEMSLSSTEVANGDTISVSGQGFRPDEDVFVTQCNGTDPNQCDVMGEARVATDPDGSFSAELRVVSEILTYDGWQPCAPCALRASAYRVAPVSVPITVAANREPSRPAVRIAEPGPYVPGQRVTVEGEGFPLGRIDMTIGWCRLDTPDGYVDCVYPNEGFTQADATGRVRIANYPMPPADFGCRPPERCGLAWLPSEGSPPAFTTPFEMMPAP